MALVLAVSEGVAVDFVEGDVVLLGRYCGEDVGDGLLLVRADDVIARKPKP